MLLNKFISPFILFIIVNTVLSTKEELQENETIIVSQFYQKFQDGYYLFFYTILWGFLIDYSLYQILYNKQSFDNISQHTVLNFIIISGQIINNCCYFQSYRLWFNFAYITIEFSIAVLELLQILIGNRIQMLKLEKQYSSSIEFYKTIHHFLGGVIYVAHKLNLSFYTFLYFIQKSTLISVFITAQVIILPILVHTWFYFLNNLQKTKIQINQSDCLITSHEQKKLVYKHLVQQIENEQIEDNSNNKISLSSNTNIKLNQEQSKNKVKWVLIEDNLFDITGFMHPLGRFLLKQVQRQDITREYYGLKSCLFYNRKTKDKKFIKHSHVNKTNNFLENRCISKINMNSFIKQYDHQERNNTATSFQFEKIDKNFEELTQKYLWKIDLYYPEQDEQQTKIFQIKDFSNNYSIDIKSFWPYYFGKYFLITTQQQNIDWMYFSFSLSPAYIKSKIQWISSIKNNLENDLLKYLDQSVQNLNLFYELENNQDLLSNCKHLCLLGQSDNFQLLKNKKLQLSKPLGGLCIEGFSCRNYLIIAKDQAIYPLIDFIEFLACKTLMESSDMDIQHFIFGKEYLAYFHNQPKIYIYLELSKKFIKEAGFLLLNNLNLINKQYQSDKDKKIIQILRKVVICMKDVENDSILVNQTRNKIQNFHDILKALKISKSKKPDMVMLGGNQEFQSRAIKGFNLQMNKLQFL